MPRRAHSHTRAPTPPPGAPRPRGRAAAAAGNGATCWRRSATARVSAAPAPTPSARAPPPRPRQRLHARGPGVAPARAPRRRPGAARGWSSPTRPPGKRRGGGGGPSLSASARQGNRVSLVSLRPPPRPRPAPRLPTHSGARPVPRPQSPPAPLRLTAGWRGGPGRGRQEPRGWSASPPLLPPPPGRSCAKCVTERGATGWHGNGASASQPRSGPASPTRPLGRAGESRTQEGVGAYVLWARGQWRAGRSPTPASSGRPGLHPPPPRGRPRREVASRTHPPPRPAGPHPLLRVSQAAAAAEGGSACQVQPPPSLPARSLLKEVARQKQNLQRAAFLCTFFLWHYF